MDQFWNQVLWGNKILNYMIAAGGILVAWITLKVIKGRIIVLLKRVASHTDTSFDDLLVKAAEKFIIPFIYLLINYHIINQLNVTLKISDILDAAILVITLLFSIRLINYMIHGAVIVYMERKNEPAERIKQLSGILLVTKGIIWGMGILLLSENLGYDVTAIIAGLGVGGIAIALAAQNILSDLFSYLVIFFDKPFEVGDFIVTGNDSGVVEKIGIKTTYVRSLSGEQVVMPNSEMVKEVVHNFKRMERRRIVFSIGVVYHTPANKLEAIPALLRNIISGKNKIIFDRAHLKNFGDFSINFEIVYYIESADYMTYMDAHQNICFNIFKTFEREAIEFAFPTQTIFLNKQEKEEPGILN